MAVTEGKHFLAPIGTNPKRILDLGTGTGVWAIEGTKLLLTSCARLRELFDS